MFSRHPISPTVLTLKLPPSSLPQASYAKELINVPLKHGNNLTKSKQILKELSENTMTCRQIMSFDGSMYDVRAHCKKLCKEDMYVCPLNRDIYMHSRDLHVPEGKRVFVGTFRTNNPYQIVYTLHPLKNPESDFSQHCFPSKDILLLPNLPDSKNCLKNRYLEEQIHWIPL